MNAAAQKTACVIIIGNEILSGRTQDANLSFIGRRCDALGIRLEQARVIPDIEATIIEHVRECASRFDYVFTTGGIGPTHDDITSASVAKAFGLALVRRTDAVAAMQRHYGPGQLNAARLKMAEAPEGVPLIDNPVSGAPGFQVHNVFVLPGVPDIMQAMFDGITDRLAGGAPILTESVGTDLREGDIAPGLDAIQSRHPDITIGSYPYFRQGRLGVNIVSRGTDAHALGAVTEAVRALVRELGGNLLN